MTISDAQHRLLLDNLTTATLLLNAELRLEYMNPAAEMLLAVSGQRSHGQFISELFTESTEALNSLRQAVEQAHPFTKREAMLTALETALAGDYVLGDQFTMADCAVYVSLPLAALASKLVYGEDLVAAAGIDWKGYVRLIEQRPSAQKVAADRKADQARAMAANKAKAQ